MLCDAILKEVGPLNALSDIGAEAGGRVSSVIPKRVQQRGNPQTRVVALLDSLT